MLGTVLAEPLTVQKYFGDSETSQNSKSSHSSPSSQESGPTYQQVHVQGLHCAHCLQKIESLPQVLPLDVLQARFHMSSSLLHLSLTKDGSLDQVLQTITSWGYHPTPVSAEESLELLFQKVRRQEMVSLAVAGALASNIMILAISIYLGIEGEMAVFFNYLQGLLFLLFIIFAARPIYQGAFRALKQKRINVDLPLVVALWTTGIFSYISLFFLEQKNLYFDSTSGFIFLILATRFAVARARERAELKSFVPPASSEKILGGKSVADLKVGDVIELFPDSSCIVPIDAELMSKEALCDVSLMTGEPMPRVLLKGQTLLSGMRILSRDSIQVRVLARGSSTQLSRILRQSGEQKIEKSLQLKAADRAAQYLILTVFLLAIGVFLYFLQSDAQEGFSRALSLIVMACPCALGLGYPLVLSRAIEECARRGIYVSNPDVFSALAQVKTLFFDKTGTLTKGQLRMIDVPLISQDLKNVIFALTKWSNHPISRAVQGAWQSDSDLKVDSWVEIPSHLPIRRNFSSN